MPRGNDASQASAELQKKLGVSSNAEELIAFVKDRYPAKLRALQTKGVNEAVNADLDHDAVAKAVKDDGELVDCSARGPDGDVLALVRAGDGRTHKVVVEASDIKSKRKKDKTE